FSRASRIAQRVLSRFLYGLPGVTQMPEYRSNKELSISSVDTQSASTSIADWIAECSIAALVAKCGLKFGSYSPIKAISFLIWVLSRFSRPPFAVAARPIRNQAD